MSKADMSLVRTHNHGYNLAIGEPFFLQRVMKPIYPDAFTGHLRYPQFKGEPELLEELGYMYPGKYVVVTNGAKQALLAACHALKTNHNVLVHQAPHWPTYPTIARLSGMEFQALRNDYNYWGLDAPTPLRVLTAPNNPDGSCDYGTRQWDIWDAAYASPIYGWDNQVPHHRISVWSMAKLFGPSGYRVGWLVTGDEDLANKAAQYVEQTTSGVAIPSQEFATKLLRAFRNLTPENLRLVYGTARGFLNQNTDQLCRLRDLFAAERGFTSDGKGMFAWIEARDPSAFETLMAKAQVLVVDGKHCGQAGWYRISLGNLPEVTEKAVDAILKVYSGSSQ